MMYIGEKPNDCNLCEKRFATKKDVESHVFTHNSEKQFECSRCNTAFKHKGNMHLLY